MEVENVHNRIKKLSHERKLTPYELAKRSGMPQSVIYNMFERGTMPKIDTLDKICGGLGVTMSDFFAFDSKPCTGGYLSESDVELLEVGRQLSERNREHLMAYARGMIEAQNDKE
jgi:transcriptional regulator with XRE-family HTH domain